jgi:hypothetical protein
MASKSPVSAVSQAKGSSAPETPSAIPTSPRTVPFPSPQTFDFLPSLHVILLRLLSSAQVTNQAAAATAATNASSGPSTTTPSQPQQQHKASQQSAPSATVPATSSAAGTTLLGSTTLPPLDVKDLPTAASAVKIRIQKARAVIEGLPDVARTVEEQEQEIDELQDRIGRLRSVIAEFGRRAGMDQNENMDTGP